MKRILIVEYLQKLRPKQPMLFFCVVAFIIIQLILTLIRLEVTPFFLYGMYSENIVATDSFSAVKILVNEKPLEEYHSPLRERYLLEETAMNYEKMKKNNNEDIIKTRIESRYSFIQKIVSDKMYNSYASITAYPDWFKNKCLQIAGLKNGSVKLVRTSFYWDKQHLHLIPFKHEVLEDL